MNAGCRQLIVDHLPWIREVTNSQHPSPCVFGDLLHCVPDNSFNVEDNFNVKLYDLDKALLFTHQWCFTHGRMCPLFGRAVETNLETAGLPCTDQSRAGNQLYEQGPTAVVFIAHAKRHIQKRTPFIIIENVQELCLELLSFV
jgi:hypothetical protein